MGLPWPEWGETDVSLAAAFHRNDSLRCGCGCGQYRDESWDPDTDGEWEIDEDTVCYAGAALQRWREEAGSSTEPGLLVSVRRVTAQEQRDRSLAPPRAGS